MKKKDFTDRRSKQFTEKQSERSEIERTGTTTRPKDDSLTTRIEQENGEAEKAAVIESLQEAIVENKAGYTAEGVACDWAGAVMQNPPEKRPKSNMRLQQTNQLTDRPTDLQPT